MRKLAAIGLGVALGFCAAGFSARSETGVFVGVGIGLLGVAVVARGFGYRYGYGFRGYVYGRPWR